MVSVLFIQLNFERIDILPLGFGACWHDVVDYGVSQNKVLDKVVSINIKHVELCNISILS